MYFSIYIVNHEFTQIFINSNLFFFSFYICNSKVRTFVPITLNIFTYLISPPVGTRIPNAAVMPSLVDALMTALELRCVTPACPSHIDPRSAWAWTPTSSCLFAWKLLLLRFLLPLAGLSPICGRSLHLP